jgi:hypothetical protein
VDKTIFPEQGTTNIEHAIKRGNSSSIKAEMHRRMSSSKLTRHSNIKYFHITGIIEKKEAEIEY